MSDTNDMRRDFEAWFMTAIVGTKMPSASDLYILERADKAWVAWQSATERATQVTQQDAKDAARYRWLRTCNNDSYVLYGDTSHCELMMEEELDKAIDEAIRQGGAT